MQATGQEVDVRAGSHAPRDAEHCQETWVASDRSGFCTDVGLQNLEKTRSEDTLLFVSGYSNPWKPAGWVDLEHVLMG